MKTVVLGASPNPDRYAYRAVRLLNTKGFEVEAVGARPGSIGPIPIQTGYPTIQDVHTISLYVGPKHQPALYDYILSLKPKRILFNPGTENIELENLAKKEGIATERACTLVLLSLDQYVDTPTLLT